MTSLTLRWSHPASWLLHRDDRLCVMETQQLCIMWRPVVGIWCWKCFCRKTAGWIPYVYRKELDLVKNSLLNIPEGPWEGFLCVFLGSAEKQTPPLNGFVRDGQQLLAGFLLCPFSLNFLIMDSYFCRVQSTCSLSVRDTTGSNSLAWFSIKPGTAFLT